MIIGTHFLHLNTSHINQLLSEALMDLTFIVHQLRTVYQHFSEAEIDRHFQIKAPL